MVNVNDITTGLRNIFDAHRSEYNDRLTREHIIMDLSHYLNKLVANREIDQYIVVCDRWNNPPILVSQNGCKADVYISDISGAAFVIHHIVLEKEPVIISKEIDYLAITKGICGG